jgi:hypothetical protein
LAIGRKVSPLFFEIQLKIENITDNQEAAREELIARNPIFYKKSMFRAFLGYSENRTDKMSIQEYLDCCVILHDVLRIWHAPFLDHDNS